MNTRKVVALSIGTASFGLCAGILISYAVGTMLIAELMVPADKERHFAMGMANGILLTSDCREAATTINNIVLKHHLSKNELFMHAGDPEKNEQELWKCGIITADMVEK